MLKEVWRFANREPHRPAFCGGGVTLTYGELYRKASALASWLQRGTGPVALEGEKDAFTLLSIAACCLAGRPYCIIDPRLPDRQTRLRRETAAVTLLLGQEGDGSVPALTRQAAQEIMERGVPEEFRPCTDPETPAYILFTSGSTGVPKGVVITAANIENFVCWMDRYDTVRTAGSGRFISATAFSFDLSLLDLFYCWHRGGCLVIPDTDTDGEMGDFISALGRTDGHLLICTPTYLKYCLADPAFGKDLLPHLSVVLFCGEDLQPGLVAKLRRRFPDVAVYNAYGPTEATCAVSATRITDDMLTWQRLPMGDMDRNAVHITVESPFGTPVPDGEEGEIVLVGASVGAGYVGGEAGFFARGTKRGYRTGDTGYIQDGHLYFIARRDRQIKYKGYRIETGEIESVLEDHPAVQMAAVLPKTAADGRVLRLVAFVAAQGVTGEELREYVARSLPAYAVPRTVTVLAELPTTHSGKCDRKKLAEEL